MEQAQHQPVRLIACPHMFSIEKGRIDVLRPEGGTVADHLRSIGWTTEGLSARVFLDGELVTDARWEYVTPHAGQSLVARAIPMGGQGGDGQGKDAIRIVAMIAIIAASIAASVFTGGASFLALGAVWGAVAGAAVSLAGTLAMNGLIPTPLPRRALPQPMPERALQEAA